jgi:cytochrome c
VRYLAALAAIGLVAIAGMLWWAADTGSSTASGGAASRGAVELVEFGCGACHTIPAVTGARGTVGPPLAGLSKRAVIAGRLPNTTADLIRWIMHPQAVEPGTAMPELGVPEPAARDMAAYLDGH